MEWLHDNKPDFDERDDKTIKRLTRMTGIHMPKWKLMQESREKMMRDAIEWFRNHNQDFDDVSKHTVGSFMSVMGVPKPQKLIAKNKKKAMVDTVGWLHNNNPNVESKREAIDGFMDWLQKNNVPAKEVDEGPYLCIYIYIFGTRMEEGSN